MFITIFYSKLTYQHAGADPGIDRRGGAASIFYYNLFTPELLYALDWSGGMLPFKFEN